MCSDPIYWHHLTASNKIKLIDLYWEKNEGELFNEFLPKYGYKDIDKRTKVYYKDNAYYFDIENRELVSIIDKDYIIPFDHVDREYIEKVKLSMLLKTQLNDKN